MGEEVERTPEKESDLSEKRYAQNHMELDYEKDLLRLEIIRSILDLFRTGTDAEYLIIGFLSGLDAKKKRETCDILNSMADSGEICYIDERHPDFEKIDIDNIQNIPENIRFRLNRQPYGIVFYTLETIYHQAQIYVERYKENEKNLNQKISDFRYSMDEIASVKNDIDLTQKKIKQSEDGIEKNAKSIEKEINDQKEQIKKIGEESSEKVRSGADKLLADISDMVKGEVEKNINQELTREGKIGAFIENMQKDLLQYMGIFIAVFALVNLNLSGLDQLSMRAFLAINLSLVASMTTLAALLAFILHRPTDRNRFPIGSKSLVLALFAIVLWCITIYVVFFYRRLFL